MRFNFRASGMRGDVPCKSCRFAMRRDDEVVCTYNHPQNEQLKKLPLSCNAYQPAGLPSFNEMTKIAWRVSHDGKGKAIGFRPPTKEEQDEYS